MKRKNKNKKIGKAKDAARILFFYCQFCYQLYRNWFKTVCIKRQIVYAWLFMGLFVKREDAPPFLTLNRFKVVFHLYVSEMMWLFKIWTSVKVTEVGFGDEDKGQSEQECWLHFYLQVTAVPLEFYCNDRSAEYERRALREGGSLEAKQCLVNGAPELAADWQKQSSQFFPEYPGGLLGIRPQNGWSFIRIPGEFGACHGIELGK